MLLGAQSLAGLNLAYQAAEPLKNSFYVRLYILFGRFVNNFASCLVLFSLYLFWSWGFLCIRSIRRSSIEFSYIFLLNWYFIFDHAIHNHEYTFARMSAEPYNHIMDIWPLHNIVMMRYLAQRSRRRRRKKLQPSTTSDEAKWLLCMRWIYVESNAIVSQREDENLIWESCHLKSDFIRFQFDCIIRVVWNENNKEKALTKCSKDLYSIKLKWNYFIWKPLELKKKS